MPTITINTEKRFDIEKQIGIASSKKSFSFNDFSEGSGTYYIYSEPFKDFLRATGSFSSTIGEIPYVDVKAYYQKTLIQNLLNLTTSFTDGIQKGMTAIVTLDSGKLKEMYYDVRDIITGMIREEGWGDVFDTLLESIATIGGDPAIEKLPYVLMIQLMSTIGINTYKFPLFSQEIMKSSSNYGWGQQKNLIEGGATGGAFSLLKTINANLTPIFNPNSGGGSPQTLTIEFDLFNDTPEKAEANTQFVKTLVVRNMWLQYGIFQTPGALYDIKIGSGLNYFNAMYMCTGEFTISKKGVMRIIDKFFVPDVYNVKATFSSLLPSNVNTYIFGKSDISPERTSVLEQFLRNASNVLSKFGDIGTAEREANETQEVADEARKEVEATKQELDSADALVGEAAAKLDSIKKEHEKQLDNMDDLAKKIADYNEIINDGKLDPLYMGSVIQQRNDWIKQLSSENAKLAELEQSKTQLEEAYKTALNQQKPVQQKFNEASQKSQEASQRAAEAAAKYQSLLPSS